MLSLPALTALLDSTGHRDTEQVLVCTATVVVTTLVVAAFGWTSLKHQHQQTNKKAGSISPPRVPAWPLIGSALEFGTDCRAFLKKYFTNLQSPIMTVNLAGNDYHFVDPSYAEFSLERLFRFKALQFQPMANDALQYGFGVSPDVLKKYNGPDGNATQIKAVYHAHLMKSEGLNDLLVKAQKSLNENVFTEEKLYPSASNNNSDGGVTTKPLHWLVCESLFRTTIAAVLSDSIVTTSSSSSSSLHNKKCTEEFEKDVASKSLEEFSEFDKAFPLLISKKVPTWMCPTAIKSRQALRQKCEGPAFEKGASTMTRDRNQVAETALGIRTESERAPLSVGLMWASTANLMPTAFWLIYNLLKHKDTAYAAIQTEVDDFFDKRQQEEGPLTVEELDKLIGLDSALTESLRLYSESMIVRHVTEDYELDLKIPVAGGEAHDKQHPKQHYKYFLKKESRVAVLMSLVHMDESVFRNASSFQWDRFRPDAVTGKKPVFRKQGKILATPVRPFGGGVSMCPGRKFASYEIKIFVAELLHRYDLELLDKDKNLKTDSSRAGVGIYSPLEDVNVRISRRLS